MHADVWMTKDLYTWTLIGTSAAMHSHIGVLVDNRWYLIGGGSVNAVDLIVPRCHCVPNTFIPATCDECAYSPCQNGGICRNSNSSATGYTCECPYGSGYSGVNCDIRCTDSCIQSNKAYSCSLDPNAAVLSLSVARRTDLPAARSQHASFTYGNTLYVVGKQEN